MNKKWAETDIKNHGLAFSSPTWLEYSLPMYNAVLQTKYMQEVYCKNRLPILVGHLNKVIVKSTLMYEIEDGFPIQLSFKNLRDKRFYTRL